MSHITQEELDDYLNKYPNVLEEFLNTLNLRRPEPTKKARREQNRLSGLPAGSKSITKNPRRQRMPSIRLGNPKSANEASGRKSRRGRRGRKTRKHRT
jgi:hypothetical protein